MNWTQLVKRICRALGIVIVVCCGVLSVYLFLSSAFPGGAAAVKFGYVNLAIVVVAIVGVRMMTKAIQDSGRSFWPGLLIGIVFPPLVFFGYSAYAKDKDRQFCLTNPQYAFCKQILTKEEISEWLTKNCQRISRENYYYFKCNVGGITVPDEYVGLWSSDRDKAVKFIEFFDYPASVAQMCTKMQSPINQPTPNGRICAGVYGSWPDFSPWKVISFTNSIANKTYQFELQNYDMTIVCNEKSEHCQINW